MKKITLLCAVFMAGFAVNAQTNSFEGPGGDGTVITPTQSNRAPIVLESSVSQDIIMGREIACASPTAFRNNNMFTPFDVSSLPQSFALTGAQVAIGPVITPGGFLMTVNIWANDGTFPGGALTLIGTGSDIIMEADAENIFEFTFDAAAIVPADTDEVVLEVIILDDGSETNFMRFGANDDGPEGANWIQADDCGAATPQNFTALGLTQNLVMNLLGDDDEILGNNDNALSQVSIFPNPAQDILNVSVPSTVKINSAVLFDVLGKDTGLTLSNGTINTSSLARGVYILNIQTDRGAITEKIVKQ